MKSINKILYAAAMSATLLIAGACSEEIRYIYPEPEVSRFTVSPLHVDMGFGEDVAYTVAVRPGNTSYVWESSDPDIAYVDENDHIVSVGTGTVTFTCSAGELNKTVTATIHPSLSISKEYLYIKSGETSAMEFVRVLPESADFTVTTDNAGVVSIADAKALGFTAGDSGVASVSIAVADGEDTISGSFTVAVVGGDNVINAVSAAEYFYDAETLNHPVYGISALALTPAGAQYADGGQWSGTGLGLFLKVYNPERGTEAAALPAGTYTAGESANNFFANGSYIIDVQTGDRTSLTAGELALTADGLSGYVTAGGAVYEVKFSGTRKVALHEYPYSELSFSYTAEDFTYGNTLTIDHNGTVFYGGVTNVWVWRLRFSDTHYVQLVFRTEDTNNPMYDFPVVNSYFSPSTCIAMGWGWTTLLRNGSLYYYADGGGTITVDNYVYANPASAGFHGSFGGMCTDSIEEIGESRSIAFSVALDVESLEFEVAEY